MADFRQYRLSDRAWVAQTQSRHYLKEEGFTADFADAMSKALDFLEEQRRQPLSDFVIAESDGNRIGCVFIAPEDDCAVRIRLFFILAGYRRHGVGRLMLEKGVESARGSGVQAIRVSTFDRHAQACRLYRTLGFATISDVPVSAFGQQMRQIDFELNL